MNNKKENKKTTGRRDFLKLSLLAGGSTLAAGGFLAPFAARTESRESVSVLTNDGRLATVPKSSLKTGDEKLMAKVKARKGIKGKKFVMVIDLSRCKNARNCQVACQKHHNLPEDDKWVKIYKMKDSDNTAPYFMPKTCFHCDNPPCVKVCPVGATYKREDGIVLIDNERCIGCRFCMAGCPYSSRSFNWSEPAIPEHSHAHQHDPETGQPRRKGTVEKCDFCPDMLEKGELPHCVSACPNGVYYFGDLNEDAVTNGDETVRFSELIRDKAGYRYLEDLGTQPSVYYLPPVNRLFPFDENVENEANPEES